MSLLDAFLLDPAPFNVWIAHRTDGVRGSGTASDPWNGGTQALFDGVMSSLATLYPNARLRVNLGPAPESRAHLNIQHLPNAARRTAQALKTD